MSKNELTSGAEVSSGIGGSLGTEVSETTADLDDVGLLTVCSRQDLFELIKEDPQYYLDLIRENQLGDQLMVKTSRHPDGAGLRIKFRIYPEDRWTEVGYFGDCEDDEVLDDFRTQITGLLNRTRRSKEEDRTAHLGSQLDANNDITSKNYGADIPGLRDRMMETKTPLERKLDLATGGRRKKPVDGGEGVGGVDVGGDGGDRENLKVEIQSQNVIHSETSSPISYLNQFTAGLIDTLIKELPSLLVWDSEAIHNLPKVLEELSAMDVPSSFEDVHQGLVLRLSEQLYLAKLCEIGLDQVMGLKSEIAEFHERGMKINHHFYLELNWSKIETSVLEPDDLAILRKYGLNIREIWQDYVRGS